MSDEKRSAWEMANTQLENAAKYLPKDKEWLNAIEYLKHCQRMLSVSLPILMDDGTMRVFDGYRVQHCDVRGPTKGGVRYAPAVDLDEVKALAFWDDYEMRGREPPVWWREGRHRRRPIQAVEERAPAPHEAIHVRHQRHDRRLEGHPRADVGTNAQIMAYMMDTYAMIARTRASLPTAS